MWVEWGSGRGLRRSESPMLLVREIGPFCKAIVTSTAPLAALWRRRPGPPATAPAGSSRPSRRPSLVSWMHCTVPTEGHTAMGAESSRAAIWLILLRPVELPKCALRFMLSDCVFCGGLHCAGAGWFTDACCLPRAQLPCFCERVGSRRLSRHAAAASRLLVLASVNACPHHGLAFSRLGCSPVAYPECSCLQCARFMRPGG